jgi:outer membrane protein TolC
MTLSALPRSIAPPRPRLLLLLCALGLSACHTIAPSSTGPVLSWVKPGPPACPILPVRHDEPEAPAAIQPDQLAPLGPPAIPLLTHQQTIDLCGALERAGIENPTIALAAEAVRASEALRLQAQALLLPSVNVGTNARVHQGPVLSGSGVVRDVNLQSVDFGLGAGAYGSGTTLIPGVRVFAQLADAYYAPQEAQQQVVARRYDAAAVRNQTLLEVGTAYLVLVGAHAELASLRRSDEDVNVVVQMTANFAKAGQGKDSDAQRARSRQLLLVNQAQQTQEQVAVAGAELARLLDLDPSTWLVPADAIPPLIELIDPGTPLPDLVQLALANHPELGARSADIATAQIHVRQERVRPWLPLISAGFSVGDFGGAGSQSTTPGWSSGARMDFDVYAAWSLQNLGLGNRALVKRAQADVGQAEADRLRVVNRIRDEVGEAYALIVARKRQVEITRRRIERAQRAFDEDLLRSRNLEGRPIEVLRSLELLTNARLDLVRTLVGYSQGQLQLFVALGNAPVCPR